MDIDLDRNPEPQATLWSCCGEIDMDLCPWTKRDNVRDHRVRTIDLPFQNHAQAGLRVHRIVIHPDLPNGSAIPEGFRQTGSEIH